MAAYDFALDYGTLHEARKDLHDLANRIGPTLKSSVFSELGDGTKSDAEAKFGNSDLTSAFRTFYRLASGPMKDAEDRLKQLGDTFGGVADGFFNTDAEISQGLGVMGGRLGLDEWRRKKAAWDYYNQNKDKCVPDENGKMPDFCYATDPGDPPTSFTVTADDGGKVQTQLTLDKNNNVTKEVTTVTHNGQTYTSVTTYSEDGKSHTTETTYADGTKTTSKTTYGENRDSYTTETTDADGKKSTTVVDVKEDGSGTMTITDADGTKTEYRRNSRWELWKEV